jgi:hypothetical protein
VAVPGDFVFLRHLIDQGVVSGPVLEVGSRDHQGGEGNAQPTCQAAGLSWEGADIAEGPGVDFLLDVLDAAAVAAVGRRWPSVLLFNLLEHVYDPPTALRNAVTLTEPGGVVAVAGPAVWELHDYPADYWRPMPDFFHEFARREGLQVVPGTPHWIVNDRLLALDALVDEGAHRLPSKHFARQIYGAAWAEWSRVVHRTLNTLGRGRLFYPQSGLGIALRRPASPGA